MISELWTLTSFQAPLKVWVVLIYGLVNTISRPSWKAVMTHTEYFHSKSVTCSLPRTFDGHLCTIFGPRSLCRPSTLHHPNQLHTFATVQYSRPSDYWPNSPIWPKRMCFIFGGRWHGRRQSVSRTCTVRWESANKLYWATVRHLLPMESQLLSSATRIRSRQLQLKLQATAFTTGQCQLPASV